MMSIHSYYINNIQARWYSRHIQQILYEVATHLNQPANNHHREYDVMKILAVDFTQASPPESR